ncbi:Putative peroxiredoxin bcp [Atribacter laminatus]|uniref:thioredoxin-dependent peroxiredoxin n=2 Tax=Atribacter laminatus TaxID=2847778 RepID=A0A7T1AL39_ATRLM|nr:Putative peroxiredoxin bcp [Atribacter laminatus]
MVKIVNTKMAIYSKLGGHIMDEDKKFPDFLLKGFVSSSQTEETFSLSSFQGKWVIFYFYPRDATPGCTKEAIAFTEKLEEIRSKGVEVVGVSTQSVESHQKFAKKYNLKHILLSDDGSLSKNLGILGVTGTAARTTFLVDPQGFIVKDWKKVKVAQHVEEVLEAIDEQCNC